MQELQDTAENTSAFQQQPHLFTLFSRTTNSFDDLFMLGNIRCLMGPQKKKKIKIK